MYISSKHVPLKDEVYTKNVVQEQPTGSMGISNNVETNQVEPGTSQKTDDENSVNGNQHETSISRNKPSKPGKKYIVEITKASSAMKNEIEELQYKLSVFKEAYKELFNKQYGDAIKAVHDLYHKPLNLPKGVSAEAGPFGGGFCPLDCDVLFGICLQVYNNNIPTCSILTGCLPQK